MQTFLGGIVIGLLLICLLLVMTNADEIIWPWEAAAEERALQREEERRLLQEAIAKQKEEERLQLEAQAALQSELNDGIIAEAAAGAIDTLGFIATYNTIRKDVWGIFLVMLSVVIIVAMLIVREVKRLYRDMERGIDRYDGHY